MPPGHPEVELIEHHDASNAKRVIQVDTSGNPITPTTGLLTETTFTGRVGEVQTTPTSNTLLGRLKDLLTGIVLAAGSAIIGKVGIDQTTDGTTNKVYVGNTPTVDTELPAAAALADDETPTPTVPRVGAIMQGMDSAGGANLDRARLAKAHDMDSGAGTEYAVGVTLRKSASGGSAEAGTSTDPLRVDPTGTTTQPVNNNQWGGAALTAAAALADATAVNPTTNKVGAVPLLMNASTGDRQRAIINALNTIGTGIAAAGILAQLDDVSPTAITENQFGNLRMSTLRSLFDSWLPIPGSVIAPSNYKDAGTVTKANVKGSAGNVFSVYITNTNAAVRYFQIHNKASAPAATETAVRYWPIPAGTAAVPGVLKLDRSYFSDAHNCATGIGWAISTTITTFTDAATANEHTVDINYV